MTGSGAHVDGFEAVIHPSLGAPILLAGAPRALAIVNGTVAAAIALGLQQWLAGLAFWAVGQTVCVLAARRDPDFAPVLIRHLKLKGYLAC